MSKKIRIVHAKLIGNPGAGQVMDEASAPERATRYLMDAGLHVDVALAHPLKQVTKIAKRAVKDGYDIVIAMGGDGTIGAVIRGIAGSKVRLGILASGTENDFAESLGIPRDLKQACDLIASGHVRRVDLAQVRTRKGGKFYFFMVTAVGLTATIYPMIKNVPEGKLSGVKDAVKTLLDFEPKPRVQMTLDHGGRIEVETMLVTITNTPLIGLRNIVAPDASLDDGLLDIAVYPGWSKADVLAYFAKTSNQLSISDDKIERYRSRKIKIKTSPKLDIAAEGILQGTGKAWIKVLPRKLRVIVPEPGDGTEKPKALMKASTR